MYKKNAQCVQHEIRGPINDIDQFNWLPPFIFLLTSEESEAKNRKTNWSDVDVWTDLHSWVQSVPLHYDMQRGL